MGRFFVICPVVRCNSKQSRSVTTHSSSKIVFCKFSGVCLKHSSLTTYHCVPRTSSADQSCRQRCNFFSQDWGLHVSFPPQHGFGFLTGGVASKGGKNVLRKLLRIPYRRLKAGFSVCHCLFVSF